MSRFRAFNAATSPERLPFEEAIAFLRQKLNVPTETYRDLSKGQHARAFTIAGATKEALLSDFREAVDKAISEGDTISSFRKDFDRIVAAHGWDYKGGRNWRSRVIFNTNMRMAHAAGRWDQAQRLKEDRPYARYVAIDDEDTRTEHRAWHGKIVRIDDPWLLTHYCPNGWNCRCTIQFLSAAQVRRYGFDPDNLPPAPKIEIDPKTGAPVGIDPGFDYNVGRASVGQQLSEAEFKKYQELKGAAWRVLTPGTAASYGRPPIPLETPTSSLGPEVKSKAALEAEIARIFGGSDVALKMPHGSPVYINAAFLADHLELRRSPFLALYKEALEDPFEIWMSFEEHEGTGKVVLKQKVLRAFQIGPEKRPMLGIFQVQNGRLVAWTLIPGDSMKYAEKQRVGRLIYSRR